MSDKKGSKFSHCHAERSKKQKFQGNRYSFENDTEFTSASAKKLIRSMNMEVPVASNFLYCILEFASVFFAISSFSSVVKCQVSNVQEEGIVYGPGIAD